MGSPLYQPGRGTKRPQEFLMYFHGYLHTTVDSVLMLVCTRLHHGIATQWGNQKHRNMKYLEAAPEDTSIAD